MVFDSTAKEVADCIIQHHYDRGDYVSNLKLQKLLYYCQAWYLALYNKALFKEHFEAWVHGPVQPKLYGEFKQYGWQPIFDHKTDCAKVPAHVKAHIDEVLKVYGAMSGSELELRSHSEEPWLEARKNLAPDKSSTTRINTETMRRYYKSRLKNG
jgi:uncharacterized phage-associated protein